MYQYFKFKNDNLNSLYQTKYLCTCISKIVYIPLVCQYAFEIKHNQTNFSITYYNPGKFIYMPSKIFGLSIYSRKFIRFRKAHSNSCEDIRCISYRRYKMIISTKVAK